MRFLSLYKFSFSTKIILSAARLVALVHHLSGDGVPETGNRARIDRLRFDHRPINTRTGSPVPATWESPSDGRKQQRQEAEREMKNELRPMGHTRTLDVRHLARWPHWRRTVIPTVVWKQTKQRCGCSTTNTIEWLREWSARVLFKWSLIQLR